MTPVPETIQLRAFPGTRWRVVAVLSETALRPGGGWDHRTLYRIEHPDLGSYLTDPADPDQALLVSYKPLHPEPIPCPAP